MAGEHADLATELLQLLVGESFVQLCVGVGDAQLHFTGDLGITLESDVQVGESAAVAPSSLDGIGLLLPLLNEDVADARVSDDGELSVTIAATSVRCRQAAHYEAWNVAGPRGVLVVSTPGGLAIWSGR